VAPLVERAAAPAAAPAGSGRAAPPGGAGAAGGTRRAFSAPLTAAALAAGMASAALLLPPQGDWLAPWSVFLDTYLSIWIVAFVLLLSGLWVTQAAVAARWSSSPPRPPLSDKAQGTRDKGTSLPGPLSLWDRDADHHRPGREGDAIPAAGKPAAVARGRALLWGAALLGVCAVGLVSHTGERNGFVASSRPASGVELWTIADGYAMLLDGVLAQGDGHFLLPMLRLLLGDAPPRPGEFDRRAGHVYLVSLLARPLGAFWAFAGVNLLGWWAAALAVWWLGRRRWPGTAVPWIASLLTATGHGFLFMAAAPQAHAPAFAAFALVLALGDRLRVWERRARLGAWAGIGWATGAAGLIYFVHLPCLLFVWLYGLGKARLRGLALATLLALGVVGAWEVYASALLGLNFAGGNNDLSGQAARNWLAVAARGPIWIIGQMHASSLRGLFAGAFYYPWWAFAVVGLVASTRDNRRWALAVILAAALPAIAFTTRFNLPRVAYVMFPAIYLLAARGIEVVADAAARWLGRGQAVRDKWHEPGPDRTQGDGAARLDPAPAARRLKRWVAALAVALLVAIANADLLGVQQLNLWFHYSQGSAW
jgi:hypothetical protein